MFVIQSAASIFLTMSTKNVFDYWLAFPQVIFQSISFLLTPKSLPNHDGHFADRVSTFETISQMKTRLERIL